MQSKSERKTVGSTAGGTTVEFVWKILDMASTCLSRTDPCVIHTVVDGRGRSSHGRLRGWHRDCRLAR